MADKEASSGKSYIDSAIAAGQSVLGSITGNQADKVTVPFHIFSTSLAPSSLIRQQRFALSPLPKNPEA